jgi:predicted PurR-regulated permease PerM
MPDYVVLISTLGGIETFGLHGFIIRPVIAASFVPSGTSTPHRKTDRCAVDRASHPVLRLKTIPTPHISRAIQ